jgi:hypothetical protein
MNHSNLELARDRIRRMQEAAAQHHEGRRALVHGRALRQAERAERKALGFARAAQQIRARIARLEIGR